MRKYQNRPSSKIHKNLTNSIFEFVIELERKE